MQISELSHRTGASIRSLRYYEQKGLLHVQRKGNGYRSYDEQAIERVRRIQFYMSVGLTSEEITTVIACRPPQELQEHDQLDCPGAIAFYEQKLAEIEERLGTLEEAQTVVKMILARLKGVYLSRGTSP